MVFDPDGAGNRALKQPYPIGQADYRYDQWTAQIADTSVDDESVRGAIKGAQWRLRISPGPEQPVKLLTDRGYKARFPTAKTQVRHPLARFDGSVQLGDINLGVTGWTGSVNHNWGRRHTPAYAFGQVCGFDGHPQSSLEIVTAQAAVGPLSLPQATLFVLRHQGREFAVRSVGAARHTRGSHRPFTWSFSGRTNEAGLDGEIQVPPHEVIGLTYTDTTGKSKFCYNSALATCRVHLSGKGIEPVVLTATRRAMFEILTDTRNDEVPLLA
jgi:hypothetical protein